ncbi:Ran-interacting Mog1 protein [Toxoplasma gondii GAB2-2007-GAL-DOM2]|uniref:Mog1 protein, putative n=3 Tax=Toxoplasma gondii TaxID=5811 RepID=B9QHC3_TOXGV|nr:Ran-interacting Mog1 protein [Toxoplasma gondii VEG]KFG36250.1 Ran-interacting Mog1 protein [Toxoplasma gondii p89]KFG41564.1 Ran-interacting Mog1 protein [Toxoplasma gondii GAB2-2007-GAL-DOM2]CEL71929.1 TPA: mog1 protein, putative [Toxoplasma gondii VEG]
MADCQTRFRMVRVPLFGGAMACDLPDTFKDVSTIRQVPDNQEVFMDMSSERSVVIEIVEYQATVSDGDAARFFFCDLAKENGAAEVQRTSSFIWKDEPQIPVSKQFVVIVTGGVQQLCQNGPKRIPVQLGIIRLPGHNAEILISLYGEPCDGEQDASKVENEDSVLFNRLIGTFVITNFSLFE